MSKAFAEMPQDAPMHVKGGLQVLLRRRRGALQEAQESTESYLSLKLIHKHEPLSPSES